MTVGDILVADPERRRNGQAIAHAAELGYRRPRHRRGRRHRTTGPRMNPANTVIIHHANCPDGFGAAWWLGRQMHHGHVKHPGIYGEPPPLELCTDADVWLVDFCYEADDLRRLADVARYVTILDHHQTATGYVDAAGYTMAPDIAALVDLGQLGGLNKVAGVLDMNQSGVGLVAAYVQRQHGIRPPRFLANLEDRDLWRFNLDDTNAVFAAVTARPYTEAAWDELADTPHDDLVTEGNAITRYRDRLVEQIATNGYDVVIAGHNARIVASPYAVGSDVAGILARQTDSGLGAYYVDLGDRLRFGLRSTPEGPDVAKIAETWGGGGHKHASGFELAASALSDLYEEGIYA